MWLNHQREKQSVGISSFLAAISIYAFMKALQSFEFLYMQPNEFCFAKCIFIILNLSFLKLFIIHGIAERFSEPSSEG